MRPECPHGQGNAGRLRYPPRPGSPPDHGDRRWAQRHGGRPGRGAARAPRGTVGRQAPAGRASASGRRAAAQGSLRRGLRLSGARNPQAGRGHPSERRRHRSGTGRPETRRGHPRHGFRPLCPAHSGAVRRRGRTGRRRSGGQSPGRSPRRHHRRRGHRCGNRAPARRGRGQGGVPHRNAGRHRR